MLLALVLAATPAPPQALSVSASGGFAFSSSQSYEGSYLEGAVTGGARVQYDRKIADGYAGYFGGVVGYEHVSAYQGRSSANVGLIGPTLGARWGDKIRGGLRLAGGFAFSEGALYRQGSASLGWFFDLEGEISTRTSSGNWEVFLALPIVTVRAMRVVAGYHEFRSDVDFRNWWYAVPIIPMVANVGVRRLF